MKKTLSGKIILVLLGTLCALASVELAFFISGERRPEFDTGSRYHYFYLGDKAFVQARVNGVPVYRPRREIVKDTVFPVQKPPGTKRVFIIGSSTAQLLDETVVSRTFRQVLPGYRFEVINCGVGAGDAFRTMLMAKEIAAYSPDLIIVIVGNSERVGEPRRINQWKYRGLFSYSAVFRRLCDLVAPPLILRTTAEADRYYVRSLLRLVSDASARGVPVVLCTLPVNLRDNHFADTDTGAVSYDRDYILLLENLRLGKTAAARRNIARLEERYPGSVLLEYYRGLAAEQSGEYADARKAFMHALDAHPRPRSCPPRRNRVLRSLAAQYSLPLADIERKFISLAPRGIPGFELFYDNCHYWPPLSRVYAETLAETIYAYNAARGTALLARPEEWKTGEPARTSYAAVEQEIALLRRDSRDRDILKGALISTLAFPIFSEQAVEYLQVMQQADPGRIRAGALRPSELRPLFNNPWMRDWLPRMESRRGRLLVYAGEAMRRSGRREEAIELFTQAIAAGPEEADAYFFRGWAYRALGREKEAARDLAAAYRLAPALRAELPGGR